MEATSFLSFFLSQKIMQFPEPFSVISQCISHWDNFLPKSVSNTFNYSFKFSPLLSIIIIFSSSSGYSFIPHLLLKKKNKTGQIFYFCLSSPLNATSLIFNLLSQFTPLMLICCSGEHLTHPAVSGLDIYREFQIPVPQVCDFLLRIHNAPSISFSINVYIYLHLKIYIYTISISYSACRVAQ